MGKKILLDVDTLTEKAVLLLMIGAIIVGVFSISMVVKHVFFPTGAVSGNQQQDHFASAEFTAFDKELAVKLMDKDGDGKCDSCGMDVEFCMQSGQLQCSMDSKSTIGVLDTTKKKHHYHADFKVYINGQAVDFSQQKYFVKSGFMHVENDVPEETGNVLHMHASGVPLWLFFESIGMGFTNECFVLDTGEKYCNGTANELNFYVNGVQNNEYGSYIYNDRDKLLITYGTESQEEINRQLESITDFSKDS